MDDLGSKVQTVRWTPEVKFDVSDGRDSRFCGAIFMSAILSDCVVLVLFTRVQNIIGSNSEIKSRGDCKLFRGWPL